MQTKQKGGARANAGRKPNPNKKLPITIYTEKWLVEKIGGQELRNNIYNHLKQFYDTTRVD